MADSEKACPKCNSVMQEGFVRDSTYGGNLVSEWYEGPAQKSIWVGVKTSGKTHYPIRSYRCPGCGYLESYAA